MKSKNLKTDSNTSLLYEYFINQNKVNVQKLDELRNKNIQDKQNLGFEELQEKISHHDYELENKIKTERIRNISEKSENETNTLTKTLSEKSPFVSINETSEQRRSRSRDLHCKLKELRSIHNIPVKEFDIDADPDIMQKEYDIHVQTARKQKKIKFYRSVLFNVISGVEMANEKFDPFKLKLDDWSKQIATNIEDYDEVFGEIYEQYGHIGLGSSPWLKLLFMIAFSGVTYHMSKQFFGSDDMNSALKNNPNILSTFVSKFMSGKQNTIVKKPDNNEILNTIKSQNKIPESNELEIIKQKEKLHEIEINELRNQIKSLTELLQNKQRTESPKTKSEIRVPRTPNSSDFENKKTLKSESENNKPMNGNHINKHKSLEKKKSNNEFKILSDKSNPLLVTSVSEEDENLFGTEILSQIKKELKQEKAKENITNIIDSIDSDIINSINKKTENGVINL